MSKETYITIEGNLEEDPSLEQFRFHFCDTDGYEDAAGDEDFDNVRSLYQNSGVDYTVTEHTLDYNDPWLFNHQVEEFDNFTEDYYEF